MIAVKVKLDKVPARGQAVDLREKVVMQDEDTQVHTEREVANLPQVETLEAYVQQVRDILDVLAVRQAPTVPNQELLSRGNQQTLQAEDRTCGEHLAAGIELLIKIKIFAAYNEKFSGNRWSIHIGQHTTHRSIAGHNSYNLFILTIVRLSPQGSC